MTRSVPFCLMSIRAAAWVTSPVMANVPVSSVCVPVRWTWSTCLIAASESLKIWSALLLASSEPLRPEDADPPREDEDEVDVVVRLEVRLDEAEELEPGRGGELLHAVRAAPRPTAAAQRGRYRSPADLIRSVPPDPNPLGNVPLPARSPHDESRS